MNVAGIACNWIDLAVLILILSEVLLGLRRGMASEMFRLFGTMVAWFVGLRYYRVFGVIVTEHTRLSMNPEAALALAFLVIIVVVGLLFSIMRMVLTLIMKVDFTDAINRPGAGLAGVVRGIFLAIMIVFAVGLWPGQYLGQLIIEQSFVGRQIFKLIPVATEKIGSLQIEVTTREPAEE